MHHPTNRLAHSDIGPTTAFVTSVVKDWLELKNVQWGISMGGGGGGGGEGKRSCIIMQAEWYGFIIFESTSVITT